MLGKLPRILLVATSEKLCVHLEKELTGMAEIVHALTLEDAKKTLEEEKVAIICIIACMNSDRPNTMPFIRQIKESFRGHIVGISRYPTYRAQLDSAGCHYTCDRDGVTAKLLKLIGTKKRGR
ncbi:MAG: hypothetical protein EXS52_01505 [Candidatus Staskawiczbacteria bacterium]|nr:hypothetical protein [Candidatus Staskawiczbacteria bacterium]